MLCGCNRERKHILQSHSRPRRPITVSVCAVLHEIVLIFAKKFGPEGDEPTMKAGATVDNGLADCLRLPSYEYCMAFKSVGVLLPGAGERSGSTPGARSVRLVTSGLLTLQQIVCPSASLRGARSRSPLKQKLQ